MIYQASITQDLYTLSTGETYFVYKGRYNHTTSNYTMIAAIVEEIQAKKYNGDLNVTQCDIMSLIEN